MKIFSKMASVQKFKLVQNHKVKLRAKRFPNSLLLHIPIASSEQNRKASEYEYDSYEWVESYTHPPRYCYYVRQTKRDSSEEKFISAQMYGTPCAGVSVYVCACVCTCTCTCLTKRRTHCHYTLYSIHSARYSIWLCHQNVLLLYVELRTTLVIFFGREGTHELIIEIEVDPFHLRKNIIVRMERKQSFLFHLIKNILQL